LKSVVGFDLTPSLPQFLPFDFQIVSRFAIIAPKRPAIVFTSRLTV